ncbi:MAG: hypothetical protein V3T83_06080 [Acidobacteriota bacterium]
MAENIVASTPIPEPGSESESPEDVVLSLKEWGEIEDCATAFHAALQIDAHHGGPEAELLVAVYHRFAAALSPVRGRIDPQD